MQNNRNSRSTRSDYREVDVIRGDDGIVAVISQRISDGRYSVAIMKEFERRGALERTAFLRRRHTLSAQEVLRIAGERMDELEDQDRARMRVS